jgi:hypothetical protein
VATDRKAIALHWARTTLSTRRLEEIHAPLESAIKASQDYLAGIAEDDFREIAAEDELAYTEDLLGVAFVAAQAELTAVRTAIQRVLPSTSDSYALFRRASATVPSTTFTYVQAINHIANYWKHHDEWPVKMVPQGDFEALDWDEKKETRTIREVRALGMARGASDNIQTALNTLGIADAADLSQLRAWISEWSNALLADAAAR